MKAAAEAAPHGLRGGGRHFAAAGKDAEGKADEVECLTQPRDFATSCAGFRGDQEFDRWDGTVPITIRLNWTDGDRRLNGRVKNWQAAFQAGDWTMNPKLEPGPAGTLGVLCCDYGGIKKDIQAKEHNEHMDFDLKSGPCSILLLSGCTRGTLLCLTDDGQEGVEKEGTRGGGGPKRWEVRPSYKYLGLMGEERGKKTVMICARASLVVGMRMKLFRLIHDGRITRGRYRRKTKIKKILMAKSRILVVTCKMRFFRFDVDDDIHGGGAPRDELTVMSVHSHPKCASKDVEKGSVALNKFWDELASAIMEFQVRIFGGNFSMALFCVIPEMRARGIPVNIAAWHPWVQVPENLLQIDPMGIFIVGPCKGCRRIFDASSILPGAVQSRDGGEAWELIYESRCGGGTELRANPRFELPIYDKKGSGYDFTSYWPPIAGRRNQFFEWTFDPVIDLEDPAMLGPLLVGQSDKALFPVKPRADMGKASWTWPKMPNCRQKLCDLAKFDPQERFLSSGAYMPTMVFLGHGSQKRRSAEALKERAARARASTDWSAKEWAERHTTYLRWQGYKRVYDRVEG